MKICALVLLVGVCATTHAGLVVQRSAARESQERNLQKLSDFSAENDLYTLFAADQKDVPVNVVVADKVDTLGEQRTITLNFEESFENTIDADEEHSKFKRDLSHEENVDVDETSVEDLETEDTRDHPEEDLETEDTRDHLEEDLDSEEVETARVKRDLEDEEVVLTEYDDDWPRPMEDGLDENMVERNLHDAVEDWSVGLVEDDQFIVGDERIARVKRDLEKEIHDDDSTMTEEEEQKRNLKKRNVNDSSSSGSSSSSSISCSDSSDSSDSCDKQ